MTPLVSATIDTGALRHNLQVIRRLAPISRVMAVIKANAYGHGLVTVAKALAAADAFAVARIGEALALREAGIKTPIVLLEGVFDSEQLAAAAAGNFELVVHTQEQIDLLLAAPSETRFKVWLKLDSGMNRLGFKAEVFQAAYAALSGASALKAPININVRAGYPTIAELEALGIARASTATALPLVAMSAIRQSVEQLQATGRFDSVNPTLSHPEVQKLFAER